MKNILLTAVALMAFAVPSKSVYLLSLLFGQDNRRINRKIVA